MCMQCSNIKINKQYKTRKMPHGDIFWLMTKKTKLNQSLEMIHWTITEWTTTKKTVWKLLKMNQYFRRIIKLVYWRSLWNTQLFKSFWKYVGHCTLKQWLLLIQFCHHRNKLHHKAINISHIISMFLMYLM